MNFKIFSFKKLIATAAIASLVGNGVAADLNNTQGRDMLSIAKQKGNFTVLARAVEAAGLGQTLNAQGPMTLFAPTDEAFAKLPPADLEALFKPENKDKLVKILSYHVIAGKALDQDTMKRTRSATTAEGAAVEFALVRGRLRVDEARVMSEFTASNGTVQSVDQVLMPR
jgi:uncharacterized surface protein with fasciclin (FAS1) repeats